MDSLRQDIFNLSVIDMHNHLDTNPDDESIVAKDFWDIGEYFWVRRHLWSAGYPKDTEKLSFDIRAKEYIRALERAKNSIWVRALKRGIKDLYNAELSSERDVYALDEIIKEKANTAGYGENIAQRARLKKFVINGNGKKKFGNLSDMAVHIESIDNQITEWSNRLLKKEDVRENIFEFIKALKDKNIAGIRITVGKMDGFTYRQNIIFPNMTYDDAFIAVMHYLSMACEKYDVFIQLFLGVTTDISDIPGPFNDGLGVAKLYGLFEKYNCIFTIVTSSQGQNIDVINAANVFSNVQADGLWWYNLRPSSYRECFEQRLEELPSIRSSIVATDAYVIEWCYIKLLLIKETLFEFMQGEVQKGHIDTEMALKVSSDWLFGSAEELLKGRKL